ncbi:enediyne antibiotic chromoprotein [Streptomyces sp. NPDC032161]|uniref:enediyne antibiotic chromoprotein n=1 Tax=unclassified Streptomyces TaxID=2593676 RepID=UPI0033DD47DD
MSLRKRLVQATGSLTVLAAAAALGLQTPASAAAPKAVVTPSSGLSNGAVVKVTATGLKPGTTYNVGQCSSVDGGSLACDMPGFTPVTADGSGNLEVQVTVHSSFTGYLYDGKAWGSVDCAKLQCLVGMGDSSGNGPEGIPISFSR